MNYAEHPFDPGLGREALAFVAPLIDRAVTDPAVGQSGVLYAVIMNPARARGACSFDEAILVEQGFGKAREAWDADYAEYARKKARVSWETGCDSGADRTAPRWREEGHGLPLAGGMAVNGVVVGVSGADPAYDEVIAGAIALSLAAALKRRMPSAS
jgi:hypothetical protein